MAQLVSTWSKDPRRQIGAVAVDPASRRVLSTGYNGFPRGVRDDPVRFVPSEEKAKWVVHAEVNAIYNATLNGISLAGSHLFVYGLPPCHECAKAIVQVGIEAVYCLELSDFGTVDKQWIDSFNQTKIIFSEGGVTWDMISM